MSDQIRRLINQVIKSSSVLNESRVNDIKLGDKILRGNVKNGFIVGNPNKVKNIELLD